MPQLRQRRSAASPPKAASTSSLLAYSQRAASRLWQTVLSTGKQLLRSPQSSLNARRRARSTSPTSSAAASHLRPLSSRAAAKTTTLQSTESTKMNAVGRPRKAVAVDSAAPEESHRPRRRPRAQTEPVVKAKKERSASSSAAVQRPVRSTAVRAAAAAESTESSRPARSAKRRSEPAPPPPIQTTVRLGTKRRLQNPSLPPPVKTKEAVGSSAPVSAKRLRHAETKRGSALSSQASSRQSSRRSSQSSQVMSAPPRSMPPTAVPTAASSSSSSLSASRHPSITSSLSSLNNDTSFLLELERACQPDAYKARFGCRVKPQPQQRALASSNRRGGRGGRLDRGHTHAYLNNPPVSHDASHLIAFDFQLPVPPATQPHLPVHHLNRPIPSSSTAVSGRSSASVTRRTSRKSSVDLTSTDGHLKPIQTNVYTDSTVMNMDHTSSLSMLPPHPPHVPTTTTSSATHTTHHPNNHNNTSTRMSTRSRSRSPVRRLKEDGMPLDDSTLPDMAPSMLYKPDGRWNLLYLMKPSSCLRIQPPFMVTTAPTSTAAATGKRPSSSSSAPLPNYRLTPEQRSQLQHAPPLSEWDDEYCHRRHRQCEMLERRAARLEKERFLYEQSRFK